MNIDIVRKKFNYYIDWYADMSEEEQLSDTGRWVLKNLDIYSTLVASIIPYTVMKAAA